MNELTACFGNFRRSLSVLVPIFELASIPWKNEEQYDDFDHIAQALFSSFVVRYVEECKMSVGTLDIKYDIGEYTGGAGNYFVARNGDHSIEGRFCSFVTIIEPFDAVKIYLADSQKSALISTKDAQYEFIEVKD